VSNQVSINEKLAVDVMGWHKEPTLEFWWWKSDGDGGLVGQCRLEGWNPTTDLNQLKMCYEAAEKAFNTQTPHFTFAGTVFARLKALLRESITRVNDVVMPYEMMSAWVKHPELVAQAILEAKGVS